VRAPAYPNDEARVVAAFVGFLEADGWTVVTARPSRNEPDVIATKGGRRLIAEAKGRTMAARTDIDTMYGQLLRRMDGSDDTEYGVVVPTLFLAITLDVPQSIRDALRIRVFEVTDEGSTIER
jgi:hypothetical protein